MRRVNSLLPFWPKKPKRPIFFHNQVCIFTTLPTLHVGFTQESLKEAVNELQAILQAKGLLSNLSSKYDLDTKKSVEDFQRQNGLYVDGIVGAITWAALRYPRLCRSNQPESEEFRDAIRKLQDILRQEGFHIREPDGQFGKETERAVKSFQRVYGLRADGVAGPLTWAVLLGMRQQPTERKVFLAAVYPSPSELLCIWQQLSMISFTFLGIYFSPLPEPRPPLAVALATAFGLTCVVPFLSERLLLQQLGSPSLPLLRYAPYVLIGILSNPILHALRELIGVK